MPKNVPEVVDYDELDSGLRDFGGHDYLVSIVLKWPASRVRATIDHYIFNKKEIPPYILEAAKQKGLVQDDKN